MPAILHICTTCRGSELSRAKQGDQAPPADDDPRPGTLLLDAINNLPIPDDIEVIPVECLSACDNGCSVALSCEGKWTYVYGHMNAADASDILDGAAAYSSSTDGLVPWRERPRIFRKQCLARVPPRPAYK